MPFVPLRFRPGINREATSYSNKGGWFSCDKVRFRGGFPEKIGGWVKYSTSQFLGVCRALFNWTGLDAANYMAVGTDLKYYIERGGSFNDITPIRKVSLLGLAPLATTNGSRSIVVTDPLHGAVDGDFVTLSSATTVSGIPAGEINIEHEIALIDVNTYSIVVTTPATATGSGGGNTIQASYQINTGQAVATSGDGWGSSTFGRGTWGSGSSVFIPTSQLRIWTQSNFGEDLVFNTRGGAIFYWDTSGGTAQRAVELASLGGASDVPVVATSVLFTEDRHLVAFGANPIGSFIQDPMFIRWADQESLINWTPGDTTSAGGQRITSGSYIVGYLKMRQETLVWTDTDLYSMQYTGSPYIFSFASVGRNLSIAGPNATAVVGDISFWMGQDKFYLYNGRVQPLRCDVWKHVFGDINRDQLFQVTAGTNEGFNEIVWHYPSAGSTTNDRYVIYNYVQDIWYYGTLARTSWLDSPLRSNPTAAGTDGFLYYHESGLDDGSTSPVTPISAYIESSDAEIGEGDRVMFIRRVIPDVTFEGSSSAMPSVTMTLKARSTPGVNFATTNASAITRSTVVPVEQFTNEVWIRLRGRQAALRVESSTAGVQWQLGTTRVDLQPDGKR